MLHRLQKYQAPHCQRASQICHWNHLMNWFLPSKVSDAEKIPRKCLLLYLYNKWNTANKVLINNRRNWCILQDLLKQIKSWPGADQARNLTLVPKNNNLRLSNSTLQQLRASLSRLNNINVVCPLRWIKQFKISHPYEWTLLNSVTSIFLNKQIPNAISQRKGSNRKNEYGAVCFRKMSHLDGDENFVCLYIKTNHHSIWSREFVWVDIRDRLPNFIFAYWLHHHSIMLFCNDQQDLVSAR